MAEPFDLMQWAEEPDDDLGGGIIGQVTVNPTWIVFGQPPNQFAQFDFVDKAGGDEQLIRAKEYIDENSVISKKGTKPRAIRAVNLVVHGDAVVNRDPSNWREGVLSSNALCFTEAYKQVLKPSLTQLVEAEYTYGDRTWAQISYTEDPVEPTRVGTDGVERPNLVAYIVQVFESHEAAVEAAGDDVVNSTPLPPEPPEWDGTVDKWVDVLSDLKSTMNAKPTLGVDQFIEMWAQPEVGLTNEVVAEVFIIAVEERENEDIPF